jgi:hypothetical protein
MVKKLSQVLPLLSYFLFTVQSNLALAGPGIGFGSVANNLLEPIGLLADFVYAACFLIGGSFIFACPIKFIEHRRSPIMVPVSTPVFLLIFGAALILTPFASMYSESSVHYSLFR